MHFNRLTIPYLIYYYNLPLLDDKPTIYLYFYTLHQAPSTPTHHSISRYVCIYNKYFYSILMRTKNSSWTSYLIPQLLHSTPATGGVLLLLQHQLCVVQQRLGALEVAPESSLCLPVAGRSHLTQLLQPTVQITLLPHQRLLTLVLLLYL